MFYNVLFFHPNNKCDRAMMEFDSKSAQQPRLLIIEDEAGISEILVELGSEAGYQVEEAGSVAAAQEKFATFEPNVIILDLSLAGENGDAGDSDGNESLELLEYFAEAGSTAKILIISGKSRRKRELIQMRGQDMKLRVIGHIPKPFDVDMVQSLLADLSRSGS